MQDNLRLFFHTGILIKTLNSNESKTRSDRKYLFYIWKWHRKIRYIRRKNNIFKSVVKVNKKRM